LRLTWEQTNDLKKAHGVDRIWSFSRFNLFQQSKWEYYLRYVTHESKFEGSVYTMFGTICHDLIQKYYEYKIDYDNLRSEFDLKVLEWQAEPEYLFPDGVDSAKYLDDLRNYFDTTNVYDAEVRNEKPVRVLIPNVNGGSHVLVGYIDSVFHNENDGKTYLIDYKTSSKSSFGGKHLHEKSAQLILYGIGIHQDMKIPYEDIVLRFDMMKYVSVEYEQVNGKVVSTVKERSIWVKEFRKKLAGMLKRAGYNVIEINEMLDKAVENNNIDNLPNEIADSIKISNYYIDIEITEELSNSMLSEVSETIHEIYQAEKTKTPEITFEKAIYDKNGGFMAFAKKKEDPKTVFDKLEEGESANLLELLELTE